MASLASLPSPSLLGQLHRLLVAERLLDHGLDLFEGAQGRSLVFEHPRSHQRAVADIHRTGVAFVLEGFIGEQFADELFIVEGRRRLAVPGNPVGGLNGKLELLGSRLPRLSACSYTVLVKLFDRLGKLLEQPRFGRFCRNLALHFVKGATGLPPVKRMMWKPKSGHHVGDFALALQAKALPRTP